MASQIDQQLTRRDFLRRAGVSAAAGLGGWLLASGPQPASASVVPGDTWGILVDLTRCAGCGACALACKEANGLPGEPTELDADTYMVVEARQVTSLDGERVTRYVRRSCMHCLEAACVSACPARAMYSSEEGPVVYRPQRCLGCRYCQVGCPFGIPRFNWDKGLTATINKCWLCYERLKEGGLPACVEGCPSGALHANTREHLLFDARARIASNPGRYVDHIFGEHEVGGTSILYLSDVPFDQLGFPLLPDTAPPHETEKVMSALPYIIGGMATLMTGSALATRPRKEQEG